MHLARRLTTGASGDLSSIRRLAQLDPGASCASLALPELNLPAPKWLQPLPGAYERQRGASSLSSLLSLLFCLPTFVVLCNAPSLPPIDTSPHSRSRTTPSLLALEDHRRRPPRRTLLPRMRISAGVRDALVLVHYATAISLPALNGENMEKSLSRRADEEGNVTIPAPISVGPSQYWDGNGTDNRV